MTFTIEHDKPARDAFGNYGYRICDNNRLIARYWHDFRGDEHGIEFVDGREAPCPVGRMVDFVEGGGPEPLVLSARAVAYLTTMQAK